MENEEKKLTDRINNIDLSKLLTWTTVISIAMIAFYSLGAIKHWK